jgi:RNA:NAD 2'-phosphotransferase (TPT1/KptA family)
MIWTDNAVGGRDTPKTLYHATSREAWPKIQVQGLRPGRPRVHFRGEPDFGVWMHQRLDLAQRHPDNGPDPVVLKVNVKGLVMVGCPLIGVYVYEGHIPAERVRRYKDK